MENTRRKAPQYKEFVKKGGTIVLNVAASDIVSNQEFESIKPDPYTGSELNPTTAISGGEFYTEVILHRDDFSRKIAFDYGNAGIIIYKKLKDGLCEATCTINEPELTSMRPNFQPK